MGYHAPMDERSWSFRVLQGVLRGLCRLCVGLHVRGLEHLPKTGPCVIVANHPSYFDPMFISIVMRRNVRFVAWAPIFSWPVIGWVVRKVRAIPVDVDRPQRETLRAAENHLRTGAVVGLFPEGGRSLPESVCDPFRSGYALLAQWAQAPVVPVVVYESARMWPPEQKWPRSVRVCIQVLPAIAPPAHGDREQRRQLVGQVQSRIGRRLALWQHLRTDSHRRWQSRRLRQRWVVVGAALLALLCWL